MSGALAARTGDQELTAEVVVIGTGAGGAPVGLELARAGRDVLFLEAGARVDESEMNQRVPDMVARLYWDGGARVTASGAHTVSQGRAVGGSTVHYTAWAMRPPRAVLDHWTHHLGIPGLAATDVDPLVAEVERTLGTRPVADHEMSRMNQLVRAGAEALGYAGGLCRHNRIDCLGCGYCLLGCAYDRKQTTANTYVPAALRAGARLVDGAHVERILTEGARVRGVRARLVDAAGQQTGALTVRAERVVSAAGAINGPALLAASGIADASGELGRNLTFHTTTTVFGDFADEVQGYRGFAPAYVVDHFVEREHLNHGFYLVPAFAPPAAIAPFIPGTGTDHASRMRRYAHLAGLSVMLHDRSTGRVLAGAGGRPRIEYVLGEEDQTTLVEGMIEAGRVLFAAGARRVFAASTDDLVFDGPGDLTRLRELGDLSNRVALNTPHPQGSCRMGESRRTSVVNPFGETHDIRGLHVSDMSTFPTSIGGPPSITTAALAHRTARALLAQT